MTGIQLDGAIQEIVALSEVQNILDRVRETSSTIAKQGILKGNKDNELLAKVLEYTYNPHKKYGISENMIPTPFDVEEPKTLGIFNMLDKLANNNINNELRIEFGNYIAYFEPIKELLIGMATKDLKLGCNVNTINKIWKNLIPTSETGVVIKPMLATKFEFDKPVRTDFVVTEKLDGIRCMAICTENNIQLYTRQGKLIEGCLTIENHLSKLRQSYDSEFILDGEILATDCDYTTVYKETTKRVKNKNLVKTGLHFIAFDVLDIKEFEQLKCETPYYKRLETLMEIGKYIKDNSVIKIIQALYMGSSKDRLIELLDIYRDKGAEGLMINFVDGMYEFKRSKNIQKVKVMQTADLKVIGFEQGQGRNKGKLGALLVDFKGNTVGVGSGFTDFDREFIWKNQDQYLGKIVEVQYFEVTKDKTGTESLRFPVFKHLRTDKTEPSLF